MTDTNRVKLTGKVVSRSDYNGTMLLQLEVNHLMVSGRDSVQNAFVIGVRKKIDDIYEVEDIVPGIIVRVRGCLVMQDLNLCVEAYTIKRL